MKKIYNTIHTHQTIRLSFCYYSIGLQQLQLMSEKVAVINVNEK